MFPRTDKERKRQYDKFPKTAKMYIPVQKCTHSVLSEQPFPEIQSSAFRCREHLCFCLITSDLESGLLSRAEPLCGALAPFIKVRFPNILQAAKTNVCSDIFRCSEFPERVHYSSGIYSQNGKNTMDMFLVTKKPIKMGVL